MMQTARKLKPRLLTLALAGILGGAPLGAFAMPTVSLTAFEALGSATGPGANVMDLNANGGDYFRNGSDGLGNTSFFHTYGFGSTTTYFGARASGSGTFFVKTGASYSDSYTNSTGIAQLVTFSFNVDQGEIGVSGSGTGYADLQLRLRFNNVLVAGDHGRVDGTICNVNQGGAADNGGPLDGYLSCSDNSTASGSGNSYSVSQLVNAGATLAINYDIISEAAGTFTSVGAQTCSYGPNLNLEITDEGGGNIEEGFEPRFYCGFFNAIARSGDPASTNALNNAAFSITSAPQGVPEPGTLALAGLALGGLALARRKRKVLQG